MDANVMHPLFNSAEHVSPDHWNSSMQQKDRLTAITLAYNGTVRALSTLGLDAFLESSSLIGLLRHEGHMPWEVDGDVGIIASDCEAQGATKNKLQEALGHRDFVVPKFACRCEEDCEGDNKRIAGKVVHKDTGIIIDIFMYTPVVSRRPWQDPSSEWWERVDDDHADYTFPVETLLPLKRGTFEGVSLSLPAKPEQFLSYEYGQCLGSHVWPWRLLLYTPVSFMTPAAVLLKGAVQVSSISGNKLKTGRTVSTWFVALSGANAAVALGAFQGGLQLIVLFFGWVCELIALIIVPELIGRVAGKLPNAETLSFTRKYRLTVLAAVAAVAIDLRGCFVQLLCHVDDAYFHPLRPKIWTICLFGNCWDFGSTA